MKVVQKQTYTVHDDIEIQHEPLSKFADTSHFINGSDLTAVEVIHHQTKQGFHNEKSSRSWSQVVNNAQINDILNNPLKVFAPGFKNANADHLISLVSQEFMEYFTEHGLMRQFNVQRGQEKTMAALAPEKLFPNLGNPEFQLIQWFYSKDGQRMCRDTQGNIHSEPFVMDYVGANLDNATYYLDSLVEHLMKRDDVAFLVNNDRQEEASLLKGPLTGDEKGLAGIITDIPGYNAEHGCDETICIAYYPKSQDLEKIIAWEYDKKDPQVVNVQHFIVKKLLGGEPFLKHPVQEHDLAAPKRRFKK